ncbi:hypothetical protein HS088_TW15G00692 [Tripterygium wilfordii]|uniref:Uncharacterized protein n=1 Tax=Tripterygium wilfordii TaxID=458696 RepID=A0A7J7CM91_TRIWF|nr:hypothetical protein HS088_TW15G00692 [Tripterygium wilfordii]
MTPRLLQSDCSGFYGYQEMSLFTPPPPQLSLSNSFGGLMGNHHKEMEIGNSEMELQILGDRNKKPWSFLNTGDKRSGGDDGDGDKKKVLSLKLVLPIKALDDSITYQNNASSTDQSTITSTIDESGSTCTDLSLSPSARPSTHIFTRFGPAPQQHRQQLQLVLMGEKKKTVGKNPDFDKFYGTGHGFYNQAGVLVVRVDQSGQSDSSSSEVSAVESVGTNRISPSNEDQESTEKNNVQFIDFLGVGAP